MKSKKSIKITNPSKYFVLRMQNLFILCYLQFSSCFFFSKQVRQIQNAFKAVFLHLLLLSLVFVLFNIVVLFWCLCICV